MRVVGGLYRGRKLASFEGQEVRPTADRVKENLFNIIGNRIIGAQFLDVFGGTGAIGIEALSRGAEKVTVLDFSEKSVALINKNFKNLNINQTAVKTDSLSFLKRGGKYDIIFIDPPYASDLGVKSLQIIGENGLLEDNGFAIFEHEEPFVLQINGLTVFDERKYGRVYLTFFKRS